MLKQCDTPNTPPVVSAAVRQSWDPNKLFCNIQRVSPVQLTAS